MRHFIFTLLIIMSISSCSTDESSEIISEISEIDDAGTNQETANSESTTNTDTTNTNQNNDFEIGDIGPAGGYIIYMNEDPNGSWEYMEAAPEDITGAIEWGCATGEVEGAQNIEIGTGRGNSLCIVDFHDSLDDYSNNPEQCNPSNNGTVAAMVALEFEFGGFDDWHLPSRDEGVLLVDVLFEGGISDNFDTSGLYWTSTEHPADVGAAAAISFDLNNAPQHWGWIGKNWDTDEVIPIHIRAVRYF